MKKCWISFIPEIQNNYSIIISQEYLDDYTNMTEEEKIFLTKMFVAFSCAPIDELIEIDHEDNEWIAKSVGKTLKEQRMDTFSRKKEYEIQYADIIKVLDRMVMFN